MQKKSYELFVNLSLLLSTCIVVFLVAEFVFLTAGFDHRGVLTESVWHDMLYRQVNPPKVSKNSSKKKNTSPYAVGAYHPILGAFLQPNFKGDAIKPSSFSVRVITNNLGFRDTRDYFPQKKEGVFRVVVLGDSFAFGEGVENHQTFPAILDQGIKNVEVLNLGVYGYGNDQQLLILKHFGLKFQPDLVLIGLFNDDMKRNVMDYRGNPRPRFDVEAGELTLRNVPCETRQEQIAFHQKHPEILQPLRYRICAKSSLCSYLFKKVRTLRASVEWDRNLTSKELEVFSALLAETKRLSKTIGAKIAAVNVWDNREITLRETFDSRMRKIFDNQNIELFYVDEFYGTSISDLEEFELENDGHINSKGHQLVAKSIHQYFCKEDITKEDLILSGTSKVISSCSK